MAETRTGEGGSTRADALEGLVAALTRYNDVRESQRPPPGDDEPAAVVVELPDEPRVTQH